MPTPPDEVGALARAILKMKEELVGLETSLEKLQNPPAPDPATKEPDDEGGSILDQLFGK